jgi:hypothetical protein
MNKAFEKLQETFLDLTNGMDLPETRKNINPENMRWIIRNVKIRNGSHPQINEVLQFAKTHGGR